MGSRRVFRDLEGLKSVVWRVCRAVSGPLGVLSSCQIHRHHTSSNGELQKDRRISFGHPLEPGACRGRADARPIR
jgi:hypothetical protein